MEIRWIETAKFVAALRGVAVTIGLVLAAHPAAIAEVTGLPADLISAIGIALAGGASGIAAGQKNHE